MISVPRIYEPVQILCRDFLTCLGGNRERSIMMILIFSLECLIKNIIPFFSFFLASVCQDRGKRDDLCVFGDLNT